MRRCAPRRGPRAAGDGRPHDGTGPDPTGGPLRVLLVALGIYDQEGGIERVTRRLLRSLSELRVDGPGAVALSLRDRDARPDGLPDGVTLHPGRSQRLATSVEFVRLLVRTRPTVIVYTHVLLVPLALAARVLLPRTRQVLVVHGIEVWDRPGALRRWVVRHAIDRVVAVSRFTAERMASGYGLDPAEILSMPLAVDPIAEPGAAASDVEEAGRGGPTILTVSRLARGDAYKNIDKVIYALQTLVGEFPGLRYVVLGDGDWRPDLEALARDAGVEAHVEFPGRVPDAQRDALYDRSDLFVLPSTREGFGLVFLEAWQHTLPTIGATEGASAEVIDHGVNGLCIEPTPPAIAAAVGSLLRDPDRRRRMGEAGRRTVEERYTHRQFRERLGTILEEQLRVRNSRHPRAARSARS